MRGHYDDMPTLNVLDFVIVDILSYWPRAVKSMGQIAVTALRRPTVSDIEPLRSTDVIPRHGFSLFIIHTGKVCVFMADNMVYYATFCDFDT